LGKQVCLHTHINHAREITWVTELAAQKLFKAGVIVRNQSVLLKGVNDSTPALLELVKKLANNNIQPYYVYQCDQVMGVEDLRTPLSDIIRFDKELRGQLSGFMMPSFVVDLPGGGGKRLVSTHEEYKNGVARYKSPGLKGLKGSMDYFYHDPKPIQETVLEKFRQDQRRALQRGETLQQFFAQLTPPVAKPTPLSRNEEDSAIWQPQPDYSPAYGSVMGA
jgi:lysine 2,3-aminomutase